MRCDRCERRDADLIQSLRDDIERLEQIVEVLGGEHDNASTLCNWLALRLQHLEPDFYDTLLDDEERELFDAVAPLGMDDEAEDADQTVV